MFPSVGGETQTKFHRVCKGGVAYITEVSIIRTYTRMRNYISSTYDPCLMNVAGSIQALAVTVLP